MSNVDISVIIPTCGRPHTVGEAVRSALAQDAGTLEVIVLDDSADGSAAPALPPIDDPRLRYVHRRVPSGGVPALVRNEGIELARGRYLYLLDDDDLLEPGTLSAMQHALESDGSAGVAIGMVTPFGDDPEVLRHQRAYFARAAGVLRSTRSRSGLVARLLFDNTPLVNSACMVRREVARAVGGYSTAIPRNEDVDFMMRVARRSGFVFVDRSVVRYRTGAPSLMHSLRDDSLVRAAYAEIHRRYRAEHGVLEFTALRVRARLERVRGRVVPRPTAAPGPQCSVPGLGRSRFTPAAADSVSPGAPDV